MALHVPSRELYNKVNGYLPADSPERRRLGETVIADTRPPEPVKSGVTSEPWTGTIRSWSTQFWRF